VAAVRPQPARMPWRAFAAPPRRRPFAAFVLAAAVALGGCSGEQAPDPSVSASSGSSTARVSPSTSVTPSPSVSETGPVIPAAARVQTEAGAIAYARFFFDQFNIAWTEPRAGLIASLSSRECVFCQTTEETAVFLVEEKERYGSPPMKVLKAEAISGAPEGQQFLVVQIEQKRADILDAEGNVVDTDARKVFERYVVVAWSADRWLLFEVEKTA
jgi:hypothetical protein